MKDRLGQALLDWRIRTVLPEVRGDLLDLGCGTNELVRRHGRGVGVDVHDFGDVDLLVEDTADLPFGDASFDTVAIVAALNHIPDRMAVLREVRRVLRPGGRLVLTMIPPRISAVWHFLRRPWDIDQTERGMKPGEVWGLTAAQVRDLLQGAGFRVERERPFMLGVNRMTIATRTPDSTQGTPPVSAGEPGADIDGRDTAAGDGAGTAARPSDRTTP